MAEPLRRSGSGGNREGRAASGTLPADQRCAAGGGRSSNAARDPRRSNALEPIDDGQGNGAEANRPSGVSGARTDSSLIE